MKKYSKAILVSLMVLLFLFVSCSKKESASESANAKEAKQSYKIALVVESTVDDKGWCQAMYDGLVEAKGILGMCLL